MKATTVELQGMPKTVHIDNLSGASTILFTFTLDRGLIWESAYALLAEKQKDESSSTNSGFYESKREWLGRRHFLLAFEGSTSGMYKVIRPTVGEALREMPAELNDKYRKLSSLEKARCGWEDEYDDKFEFIFLIKFWHYYFVIIAAYMYILSGLFGV